MTNKGLLQIVLIISFLVLPENIFAQDIVTELEADGPGNTYSLISSVLAPGSNPIEAPGQSGNGCDNHSSYGEHISEVFDNDLSKNVFQFDIHADEDNDRCKNFDRQRNEIKTYDPSPNNLKAVKGELIVYNWKFKLDTDFLSTNRFTHIFQIKAKGGSDDANPLITLSTYKSSSSSAVPRLRVIYSQGDNPPSGPEYVTVEEISLEPFLGKWIEAICTFYVNEESSTIVSDETPGSIDLKLKDVETGDELLSYVNQDIDMLRAGSSVFLRPKWGIYRSLESSMPLRDEIVYFADFSITEKDQSLSVEEFELNGPVFYPNPVSEILHINKGLEGLVFELFDLSGKKLITTTSINIDMSTIKAGIYILKTANNFISRIVKQ